MFPARDNEKGLRSSRTEGLCLTKCRNPGAEARNASIYVWVNRTCDLPPSASGKAAGSKPLPSLLRDRFADGLLERRITSKAGFDCERQSLPTGLHRHKDLMKACERDAHEKRAEYRTGLQFFASEK
jgi:hypothetical protein